MRPVFSFLFCPLLCVALAAQQSSARRIITPEDAKKWESITGVGISNDGRWVWYGLKSVEGETRLVVRNADRPTAYLVSRGSEPKFAEDSKSICYRIGNGTTTRVGLRRLDTGKETTWDGVSKFAYANSGDRVLLLRPAAKSLVLFNVQKEEAQSIPDVSSFSPDPEGKQAAVSATNPDGQSTIRILDTETGELKELLQGRFDVAGTTWSGDGENLAFVVSNRAQGSSEASNRIAVLNLNEPGKVRVLDNTRRNLLPAGWRVSESLPLKVSEDGSLVAFGGNPAKVVNSTGTTVEIWNSRDVVTVPERRAYSGEAAQRAGVFVWRPAQGDVFQLSERPNQSVDISPDWRTALIVDPDADRSPASAQWGNLRCELVSLKDGSRQTLLSGAPAEPAYSSTGRWISAFDKGHWWIFDTKTGGKRNVTESAKISFVDPFETYGQAKNIPMAPAQWLEDDAAVVLTDRYDVWQASPDGKSLKRLTEGRKERVRFRWEPLEKEAATLFRAFDETTKRSGFFGLDGEGKLRSLSFEDVQYRTVLKARDNDRVVFVRNTATVSPNVFVSNTQFSEAKAISKVNVQEAEYLMPKVERIDFRSKGGEPLQGTLIYPASYTKGNRYPMVAYVYERVSDNLYNYLFPNPNAPYNAMMLSQRGYFVLMPDIVYERRRRPGEDAKDCVEAALDAVSAKSVGVDMAKVGIMGHSFGGYEAAYISTVSKRFAAAVMGSGLSDFASMAGLNYWKSGTPNTFIIESAQGRMDVPMWQDTKAYLESSAVWNVNKRSAPLLIEVGDKDDIVDWTQGLQLYNAARRAGKEAVMLVYRGEGHYLEQAANQQDYATRLRHFFDVHLKGAKPEAWLTEGAR